MVIGRVPRLVFWYSRNPSIQPEVTMCRGLRYLALRCPTPNMEVTVEQTNQYFVSGGPSRGEWISTFCNVRYVNTSQGKRLGKLCVLSEW